MKTAIAVLAVVLVVVAAINATPAKKRDAFNYADFKNSVADYFKKGVGETQSKIAQDEDEDGNVAGSYTIALADGRIQTTTYSADHINGFVAEVTYSGGTDAEAAPAYAQAAPPAPPSAYQAYPYPAPAQ